MKRKKYESPKAIIYEIIIEDCISAASIRVNLGGLDGTEFQYNTLEEENRTTEWEILDN